MELLARHRVARRLVGEQLPAGLPPPRLQRRAVAGSLPRRHRRSR